MKLFFFFPLPCRIRSIKFSGLSKVKDDDITDLFLERTAEADRARAKKAGEGESSSSKRDLPPRRRDPGLMAPGSPLHNFLYDKVEKKKTGKGADEKPAEDVRGAA